MHKFIFLALSIFFFRRVAYFVCKELVWSQLCFLFLFVLFMMVELRDNWISGPGGWVLLWCLFLEGKCGYIGQGVLLGAYRRKGVIKSGKYLSAAFQDGRNILSSGLMFASCSCAQALYVSMYTTPPTYISTSSVSLQTLLPPHPPLLAITQPKRT